MLIGTLIGSLLSPIFVSLVQNLGFSFYSRSGLDNQLLTHFGNATYNDIMTRELVIASYEFDSKSPRFYSKYFQDKNPGRYDVMVRTAVGGSSSAPIYFDPEPIVNKYNITGHLVDGGIICNNPAFYAYSIASNLYEYKKIRVISLGTGIQKSVES